MLHPRPQDVQSPRYYRPDITDNVERVKNAMLFYMFLHAWKGSVYDSGPDVDLEGIERNYREFLEAVESEDSREIIAEGIGVINHTWMAVVKLAPEELDALDDWQNVLADLEEA